MHRGALWNGGWEHESIVVVGVLTEQVHPPWSTGEAVGGCTKYLLEVYHGTVNSEQLSVNSEQLITDN
jgi:hypothetical protein